MVPSADNDPRPAEVAPDEIGRQSDPLALRLVTPEIDGPNYASIGPDHPLYRLGLLAERDRYRRPARAQEIAAALSPPGVWPRLPGERANGNHRALTAAALAGDGLDDGDVADAFGVQLDTARRLVKAGRELPQAGRDFAPYVEAVGTATQPTALTRLQSWPELSEDRAQLHELRTGKRARLEPRATPGS